MVASVLIIVISLVLFIYWFRYTSLLILSAKPAKDYGKQVARANQLSFPEVQAELAKPANAAAMEKLEAALSRDYKLLTSLLRHTPGLSSADGGFEQRMLMVDYRMMRGWYLVVRRISRSQAAAALQEMADIVAHFANNMGQACAARVNG